MTTVWLMYLWVHHYQEEVRHKQFNTFVFSSPFQSLFFLIIGLKIHNLCSNRSIASISSYVENIGDQFKLWKHR